MPVSSGRVDYNYFRYYDPSTGRYITADPIGLVGGFNLYTYVLNNPTNLIDPLGLIDPNSIPGPFKDTFDQTITQAQTILDAVTGGEFTQGELNILADLTVRSLNKVFTPSIKDAINLTKVDPTTNPIVLTKGNYKALQKILDKILKNKLDGKQLTDIDRQLTERAKKLLENSLEEGSCVIK